MRWLQRHTHVIAFQFLGEGRDPCGLVAQRFHVSPIPMIYDSGAFVLVPARKKSLHMALCFCEAFQLARTSRRHMPAACIYDTLCDTPFYMVSSDVQVVCTGSLSGFRYAVNFVNGYTTSATTSCGQRLRFRRNWRRLYRIYSRLGRRIGRIISDLKSPWKAHWPYSYGFG